MTGGSADGAAGPRGVLAGLRVPLAVVGIGIVFILGGLDLGAPAGRFPLMLGAVTVLLAGLELLATVFARKKAAETPPRRRFVRSEWHAIFWLYGTIAIIFIIGILPGSFVSVFLFTKFIEKRTFLTSILISAVMTLVIWFAFSYLAGFDMYPGLIFST